MCTGFPKEDKRFLKLRSIPDQLNDDNGEYRLFNRASFMESPEGKKLVFNHFFIYNLYLLSSFLLLFVVITFVTEVIKCICMKFCMF